MGEGGAPQPKDWFLYKKKEMWAGTHGENHLKTEAEMEPDRYQPRSTRGGRHPPTSDTVMRQRTDSPSETPKRSNPVDTPIRVFWLPEL